MALILPSIPHLRGTPARIAIATALALAGTVAFIGPARLLAQIEGDRGIPPVVNTGDLEVNNIDVDVTGKTGQEAKAAGFRDAYRQAWKKLNGSDVGDSVLESMVSGVVVDHEEIGPHRYIARLGIVFDRTRAGQLASGASVGGSPIAERSAPMLVIPVLYSGGVGQVYEIRGAWQKAWAEFRTGASAIDYVRPSGAGGDSLLLTEGQVGRRSRVWWRTLLDQFGASDVIFAEARLQRQWPGGPVAGTFTARYGPDATFLDSFTLNAPDEEGVPQMLNDALGRFDRIYTDALTRGLLRPDPTLSLDHPDIDPAVVALIDAGKRAKAEDEARAQAAAAALSAAEAVDPIGAVVSPPTVGGQPVATPRPGAASSKVAEEKKSGPASYTVEFASPDARAVDAALAAVRGALGVSAASTTSLAIGGTSVMRVTYTGSAADLAAALRARGWQASTSGNTLRIKH
jgi:hypothetical protein